MFWPQNEHRFGDSKITKSPGRIGLRSAPCGRARIAELAILRLPLPMATLMWEPAIATGATSVDGIQQMLLTLRHVHSVSSHVHMNVGSSALLFDID